MALINMVIRMATKSYTAPPRLIALGESPFSSLKKE